MKSSFTYFAYGSNMLIERLRAHCASARMLGPAVAPGYRLAFCKRGRDGSGKASILPGEATERVHGVLYDIRLDELSILDRHEDVPNGYRRLEKLTVTHLESGQPLASVSYQALPKAIDHDLQPFDWYRDLMLAGARQHALDARYLAGLRTIEAIADPQLGRPGRLRALEALGQKSL